MKRKHIAKSLLTTPGDILPIAGAAYKRAREYTADLHGLHCGNTKESALRGLSAIAVGTRRWASLNLKTYLRQQQDTGGFWMSFHEILAHYPWLVKRMGRIAGAPAPGRNFFAWFLAIFVPNISIISFMLIYAIFVVGAIGTGISLASANIKAAKEKQAGSNQYRPNPLMQQYQNSQPSTGQYPLPSLPQQQPLPLPQASPQPTGQSAVPLPPQPSLPVAPSQPLPQNNSK